MCALRFQFEEDLSRLFFHGKVAIVIWKEVIGWLGIEWESEVVMWKSYSSWVRIEKFKSMEKGKVGIVWMTMVWNLWTIRNAILFDGAFAMFRTCFGALSCRFESDLL